VSYVNALAANGLWLYSDKAICVDCGAMCTLRADRTSDLQQACEWKSKHSCLSSELAACLGLVGLGPSWELVTTAGDHRSDSPLFTVQTVSGYRPDKSAVHIKLRHVACEGQTRNHTRVCNKCTDLASNKTVRSRLK